MANQKARKEVKALEITALRNTISEEMYHELYIDLELWQALNVDMRIELIYRRI